MLIFEQEFEMASQISHYFGRTTALDLLTY